MEKMQEYMDYIFFEVWYKAIYTQGGFSLELFNQKLELKEIMEDFFQSSTVGGDLFYRSVEEIFYIFQTISSTQTNQLLAWYRANNNIEKVCQNDVDIAPITYSQLKEFHEPLHDRIKNLFKHLYGNKIIGLQAITKKIGDIDQHYHAFMLTNKKGKCPCCGLHSLKGVYHEKREAYDHYLPKGTYPFNSINFKNLIPICHECNSSYKLEKNPLYVVPNLTGGRRKAFYLYCNHDISIDITVHLNLTRKDEIKPENIEIEFSSEGYEEELETWNEVFGIEERYKAECSAENDGLDWLEQITDDLENYDDTNKKISQVEMLETLRKAHRRKPFGEKRFLKLRFLEACQRVGLFG
jgi:hypothetical protein